MKYNNLKRIKNFNTLDFKQIAINLFHYINKKKRKKMQIKVNRNKFVLFIFDNKTKFENMNAHHPPHNFYLKVPPTFAKSMIHIDGQLSNSNN